MTIYSFFQKYKNLFTITGSFDQIFCKIFEIYFHLFLIQDIKIKKVFTDLLNRAYNLKIRDLIYYYCTSTNSTAYH